MEIYLLVWFRGELIKNNDVLVCRIIKDVHNLLRNKPKAADKKVPLKNLPGDQYRIIEFQKSAEWIFDEEMKCIENRTLWK